MEILSSFAILAIIYYIAFILLPKIKKFLKFQQKWDDRLDPFTVFNFNFTENKVLSILIQNTYKYVINKKARIVDIFANAPPALFWSLPVLPVLSFHFIFLIPAFIVNTPELEQHTPTQEQFNKIKETIEILIYDPLAAEIIDKAGDHVRPFIIADSKIREYILNRLTAETLNYPDIYDIFDDLSDQKNKKNIWKIKICEHFQNLTDAAENFRYEKTRIKDKDLIFAIYSWFELQNCQEFSNNEKVYNENGRETEKIENMQYWEWDTYPDQAPAIPQLAQQSLFKKFEKNYYFKNKYKSRKKKEKICKNDNKNNKLNDTKEPSLFDLMEVTNG